MSKRDNLFYKVVENLNFSYYDITKDDFNIPFSCCIDSYGAWILFYKTEIFDSINDDFYTNDGLNLKSVEEITEIIKNRVRKLLAPINKFLEEN